MKRERAEHDDTRRGERYEARAAKDESCLGPSVIVVAMLTGASGSIWHRSSGNRIRGVGMLNCLPTSLGPTLLGPFVS
jgi:hypothetical protein